MEKRYIAPKVIKELYAKSGNYCAFPGCNMPLFGNANLSQVCHIEGLKPDSARFNPNLSDEEANSYGNLILLCSNHHNLVDQREDLYKVESLRRMKCEHEALVSRLGDNSKSAEFYQKLQIIFQECNFDEILLQQSFDATFEDSSFDMMEMGCARIRDLLKEKCALTLPGQEKQELYGFTQLAEYIMDGVAMNTFLNKIAVPRYNPQDLEATRKNIKTLQLIYTKYQFR